MAMKKDDDKTKKSASAKKPVTMSSKQPAKFGGANPLGTRKLGEINYTDMSGKKSKITADAPKGKSIMYSKGSAPKMNSEATGERNFDRTPRTRATVSVGPFTLSEGGKTAKSTGGMDMSKGTVKPKKSSNPTAKMNFTTKKPYANPTNQAQYNANVAFKEKRMRRQGRTAYTLGGLGTLAALNFSGDNNYVKQAGKWLADTPKRKEAKRVQKAENDAMIVERKAKAEAKNPSTPVAKVKVSKSTMKNIKRLKKGQ